MEIVNSVTEMGSDHTKSGILVELASRFRTDEAVRAALLDAAEALSSDHEYRRVMSALRSGA